MIRDLILAVPLLVFGTLVWADGPVTLDEPNVTLKGHSTPVREVTFSPDGKSVFSVADDGPRVWDPAAGTGKASTFRRLPRRVPLHKLWQSNQPTGDLRWKLELMDETLKAVAECPSLERTDERYPHLTGLAVSPDRKTCLLIVNVLEAREPDRSGDRLLIWDLESKQVAAGPRATDHELKGFQAVGFAADGKTFWTKSGRTFTHWKAHLAKPASKWEVPDGLKEIQSWAVDSTGSFIVFNLYDKFALLDLETGKEKTSFPVNHEKDKSVTCWALSDDGKRIATGSTDHTAKVWDVATGKELVHIEAHRGTIWSVAFSPDGKTLATASDDKTVKLWDLEKALKPAK